VAMRRILFNEWLRKATNSIIAKTKHQKTNARLVVWRLSCSSPFSSEGFRSLLELYFLAYLCARLLGYEQICAASRVRR
jgi:hypothetical protein